MATAPPANSAERHGSRRDFLKQSTLGAAAAMGFAAATSCAGPKIRPRTAVSAKRIIGANDRIHFGIIGVGNMGGAHCDDIEKRAQADNVDCVAVSDVYVKRLNRRAKQLNAEAHLDARKVIEHPDIDAVIIATPDHWHGQLALDTLTCGKNLYLQKPMTHTIPEALAVRNLVKKTKLVCQIGTQHTADQRYWAMYDLIKEGVIGKTLWAEASYSRNGRGGEWNWREDKEAGPDKTGENYIDWDTWLGWRLGLAPKRPYSSDRFFRFRKFWDYNGGIATDLFYHKLAPLVLANAGPNGEYPLRVSAHGGIYVQKDTREVPDTFIMTVDYPSEFTITLTASMANNDGSPERIRGQYATIYVEQREIRVQEPWKPEFQAMSGGQDVMAIEYEHNPRREDHVANFIDAVRGKDRLNCNVDLGTSVQVAISMAIKSYREQKMYGWDAEKEEARPC